MVYAKDLQRGDVLADGAVVNEVSMTSRQARLRIRLSNRQTLDVLPGYRIELEAVGRGQA